MLIPKKVSTEPLLAAVEVSDTDMQDGTASPASGVRAPEPVVAFGAGLQPVAASDPRRMADPRLAMQGGGPPLAGPAAPLPGVDAAAAPQPAVAPPDLDTVREMLRLLREQAQQQQSAEQAFGSNAVAP